MAVTGLFILFIAGFWVLIKEQSDFIITSDGDWDGDWQDWLIGVIVAIILIFAVIWAIFVNFYNEPESFGYEKIVVEETVDVEEVD
jgi:uncharacterized BrkB/YihY/UPF0761 family membrane protein